MTAKINQSTMDFPSKSKATTCQTFSWDEVKARLDKEFMRRGEYLARILVALRERFGDEVFEVTKSVIYRIGYEKGSYRADLVKQADKENDLENLAELISHKISRLYFGTTPELSERKLIIREEYCPLPVKWKKMGYSDDQIVEFCALFDQVDKGMVEGYNENFTAELSGCTTLAEDGLCQMSVLDTVESRS